MVRRATGAVVLAAVLSLLIASAASAATRYAASGGTGKDPCADPARPCSVFTAADREAPRSTLRAGDVVELAPGTYYAEIEGDFGYIATVGLPEGVTVRGEPGKARPVIILRDNETGEGAFSVPAGAEVADMEIRNQGGHGSAIAVSGGTVERVIARSRVGNTPTCYFVSGTIRSSACVNSGGGSAIGADVLPGDSISRSFLRNSTFVATGPGSIGMDFIYYSGKAEIDAIGVLVEGEEKDVVARALKGDTASIPGYGPSAGATVEIELQASSYATIKTEPAGTGRASITPRGTSGNITATPLLADGTLHQLPGSPTIDKGVVDEASAVLDLDEQMRTMGGAVDIGADEFTPFAAPPRNSPPATQVPWPQPKRPIRTPGRRVEFAFGSSDVGSRFECKLDRRPYRACASPYRRKVGLGEHEFRVRAVDRQGLADRTPAVFRWRVVTRRDFRR
jgi:hypothetical protein